MEKHNNILRSICQICKTSFMKKKLYEAHMNRHAGMRPHICSLCKKSFLSKRDCCATIVTSIERLMNFQPARKSWTLKEACNFIDMSMTIHQVLNALNAFVCLNIEQARCATLNQGVRKRKRKKCVIRLSTFACERRGGIASVTINPMPPGNFMCLVYMF